MSVPGCHDDVCVTCSDTAVAVTVVRLLGDGLALVDTGSGHEEVSVALVEAGPGDTVLVHAKEAIAVLADVPADVTRDVQADMPAGAPGEGAAS